MMIDLGRARGLNSYLMKNLQTLAPAICLLLLNGCAVLDRDYKVTAIKQFPHVEQKPSVRIDTVQPIFVARGSERAVEGDLSGAPVYTTPDALCEAFENSGLFSSALRNSAGADFAISFKSETDIQERSVGQSILFLVTLGLYPLRDSRTYHLTASLKDNKTGAKNTVRLEETADYWYDILLLPVGLFVKPADVGLSIRKDLNDNMAIAVHDAIVKQRQADVGSAAPASRDVAPAPVVAPPASVAENPIRPVAPVASAPVTPVVARPVVVPSANVPVALAPASPSSSVTWPDLVVKGTFVSEGKTLVLLGDGVTLENGTMAPNGIRLLDAAPTWVCMSYRGQTRTYRRNGGSFFAYTNETSTVSAQP